MHLTILTTTYIYIQIKYSQQHNWPAGFLLGSSLFESTTIFVGFLLFTIKSSGISPLSILYMIVWVILLKISSTLSPFSADVSTNKQSIYYKC